MFTSAKIDATAPVSFYTDARSERLFHEHRKLTNSVKAYIYAHPGIVGLGDDPIVSHLAAAAGFAPVDLVVLRVTTKGRVITAVAVPTRIWRDTDARSRLIELKSEAQALRTSCILVPQRWVRAETRSSVARAIAQSRQTRFSHQQLQAVLDHLRASKISTLAEAADVLRDHQDPFGAVLSMTAQGYVDIDRSSRLRHDTWIAARA
jgi:hypothetical protein